MLSKISEISGLNWVTRPFESSTTARAGRTSSSSGCEGGDVHGNREAAGSASRSPRQVEVRAKTPEGSE